jgi:multidrug efflux pump subunit AcrA (membrane-fusion protein)
MKRPPRPLLVAGVAVVLVGLAFTGWSWWGNRHNGRDVISASGRIEVTEVNVSSKATGRIVTLDVDEGTDVKQGQLIATLEGDDLQAQLRQVRAALQSGEAKLAQARIVLRVEPITVKSQIRQAE